MQILLRPLTLANSNPTARWGWLVGLKKKKGGVGEG